MTLKFATEPTPTKRVLDHNLQTIFKKWHRFISERNVMYTFLLYVSPGEMEREIEKKQNVCIY